MRIRFLKSDFCVAGARTRRYAFCLGLLIFTWHSKRDVFAIHVRIGRPSTQNLRARSPLKAVHNIAVGPSHVFFVSVNSVVAHNVSDTKLLYDELRTDTAEWPSHTQLALLQGLVEPKQFAELVEAIDSAPPLVRAQVFASFKLLDTSDALRLLLTNLEHRQDINLRDPIAIAKVFDDIAFVWTSKIDDGAAFQILELPELSKHHATELDHFFGDVSNRNVVFEFVQGKWKTRNRVAGLDDFMPAGISHYVDEARSIVADQASNAGSRLVAELRAQSARPAKPYHVDVGGPHSYRLFIPVGRLGIRFVPRPAPQFEKRMQDLQDVYEHELLTASNSIVQMPENMAILFHKPKLLHAHLELTHAAHAIVLDFDTP